MDLKDHIYLCVEQGVAFRHLETLEHQGKCLEANCSTWSMGVRCFLQPGSHLQSKSSPENISKLGISFCPCWLSGHCCSSEDTATQMKSLFFSCSFPWICGIRDTLGCYQTGKESGMSGSTNCFPPTACTLTAEEKETHTGFLLLPFDKRTKGSRSHPALFCSDLLSRQRCAGDSLRVGEATLHSRFDCGPLP